MSRTDVVIVGAGLIGSSIAMHLAKKGQISVVVIDFDLEGSLSSSELNAGGVRASWSQPLNILASKNSIEYFETIADEIGYRACGYLWLHTPESLEKAKAPRQRQLDLGWSSEIWDVAKLRNKIPFIDKTDDLAGAVFVPRDGLLNSNLLKLHYRNEAKKLGVRFVDRQKLVKAEKHGNRWQLVCETFPQVLSHEEKVSVLSGQGPKDLRTQVWSANQVVNAAGPWAAAVAQILGYQSPSHPVRRQVSIFDSRELDLSPYGMMVDPSGVYFHPEATNGLAGFLNRDEPAGVNFSYGGEDFFNEMIWVALFERSSSFEKLRHITGWAGLYEVSPDDSAIMGQVNANTFEAHSFSGHGVMHSHAAGLGVAELMLGARYETLDFSPLSGTRFEQG